MFLKSKHIILYSLLTFLLTASFKLSAQEDSTLGLQAQPLIDVYEDSLRFFINPIIKWYLPIDVALSKFHLCQNSTY